MFSFVYFLPSGLGFLPPHSLSTPVLFVSVLNVRDFPQMFGDPDYPFIFQNEVLKKAEWQASRQGDSAVRIPRHQYQMLVCNCPRAAQFLFKKGSSSLLLVRYVSDHWDSQDEGKILAPYYSEFRFLQRTSLLLFAVPVLSKHRAFLISVSSKRIVIWLC